MKSFLLFTLLSLAISCVFSSKLDFHHNDQPHKDCASESGHHFPEEKIEKLNHGEAVASDDSETAKHLLCLFKERGIISEDGSINKDVVKTRATKILGEGSEGVKKAEDCAVQRSNPKETAISYYNCVAPIIKNHNANLNKTQ